MGGSWSLASQWIKNLAWFINFVVVIEALQQFFGSEPETFDPGYGIFRAVVYTVLFFLLDLVLGTLMRLMRRRPAPSSDESESESIHLPVMWPPSPEQWNKILVSKTAALGICILVSYTVWQSAWGSMLVLLGAGYLFGLAGRFVALLELAGPAASFTLPKPEVVEARRLAAGSVKSAERRLAKAGLARPDARRLARWFAFRRTASQGSLE